MKQPEILFDLHSREKSESNPHIDILKDYFRKLQNRYKNYQQIYTDRSKEDSIVICNVYLTIHQFSLLKPKQLTSANNKFIIFSDSIPVQRIHRFRNF